MSDPLRPPSDDLERALLDLRRQVEYPPLAPVATAVRVRLHGRPDQRATRPDHGGVVGVRRRLLLAVAAFALLAGGALAVAPGVRTAVAGWLGLPGVVFVSRPAPLPRTPVPAGAPLGLGQRLVLPTLGAPDEVYVEALAHGTQVSVVYRPRRDLPAVAGTHVGLLLTEARGSFEQNPVYFKGLEPGTQVEAVRVHGVAAYWLTGTPHLFWYTDATGAVTMERIRLAGNTLLWSEGGLVFRLESALPRAAALRIAASVR